MNAMKRIDFERYFLSVPSDILMCPTLRSETEKKYSYLRTKV